eukprot:gnl/TRDRNA2_/TRDRNA2_196002_c0_seq1.p1 gnl/TRDRNA2_/TRDRNA2_196002_c0~~gnl/TRDRNA2_/TRDRNA2_196002_c0_seq1.p1  ORF type:complete len:330 (+),score=50.59 gnl/TRDRNA2_/TRDRNA2_196002_c0_seq1:60-1049(+)
MRITFRWHCFAFFGAIAVSSEDIRLGHWNLYWKALDDPEGRKAIAAGIDGAAAAQPFDFFSLVEAAGDTATFPGWLSASSSFGGRDSVMGHISGKSHHETIALMYNMQRWLPCWNTTGEMDAGRPFALGLFERLGKGGNWYRVFVLSAHFPHYPQTKSVPGQILADALREGYKATGNDPMSTPVIVLGDFNEFGECALPPHQDHCFHARYFNATMGIAPLWSYLGKLAMRDAVPFNTTTCCTKWREGIDDWWHHFDKVIYSLKFLTVSKPLEMIPYKYPGIEGACDTPACTGAFPPHKTKPTAQGSWHRGWQASLSFLDSSEDPLTVLL